MTLGERLRDLRDLNSMTQSYVGEYLQKSKQMVSLYESDKNLPSMGVLLMLSELYKTPFEELVKYREATMRDTVLAAAAEKDPGKDVTAEARAFSLGLRSRQYFSEDPLQGIPFYDVDVFAGDVETFNDGPQDPVSYLVLPGVKDCDFSCRVSGESMIRKILPGAIIACKEIKDKDLIQFGDIFLIITAENRWVKVIRRHQDSTYFLLKSHNPEYDDIDCPKNKILRLFAVKVIVNQEQM